MSERPRRGVSSIISGMTPDLWIPASTPANRRTELGAIATVHDYPPEGPWPDGPGRADMLVADDVRPALDAIPHLAGLRVIQTLSAGVDRIVDFVPPGITLCDASGVHDVAVAEWIVMAILASNRRLLQLVDAQRDATWAHDGARGSDLVGSKVLILGHGSIGRAVEARLAPFGVEIVRVARREREGVEPLSALPGLLPTADVLVVLLPLTPETRGLVGSELLGHMKQGALVVNASRGPVVDTAALMASLETGRLRAALDVTDPEPLPDSHPLWSMPGVLITPHVAGDVRAEEERAWRLVADQVGRLARGEALTNVVADGY
jgi:phosphoglycerate dehydrogenase-like enzyme